MRPILQSTHWIEWLQQGHSCFGAFLWQYLLLCFTYRTVKGVSIIKNSVWLLLSTGKVHSKERNQARSGCLHTCGDEGDASSTEWGREEDSQHRLMSLGLAAVGTTARDQRKMLLPTFQSLLTQKEVRCFSCAVFASHLCGTLQKKEMCQSLMESCHELCVRNQSGWVCFKTSYSKVCFNQYKILWYHP